MMEISYILLGVGDLGRHIYQIVLYYIHLQTCMFYGMQITLNNKK